MGENEMKESRRQKKPIRKIYVCLPYRPMAKNPAERERELDANIDRAHMACRMILDLEAMPLCAGTYFTNFMDDDDPSQRAKGMALRA